MAKKKAAAKPPAAKKAAAKPPAAPEVWPPAGYAPVITRLPDAIAADRAQAEAEQLEARIADTASQLGISHDEARALVVPPA